MKKLFWQFVFYVIARGLNRFAYWAMQLATSVSLYSAERLA